MSGLTYTDSMMNEIRALLLNARQRVVELVAQVEAVLNEWHRQEKESKGRECGAESQKTDGKRVEKLCRIW